MMDALFSLVVVCGLLVLSQLSPGPDVFFVFRTALAQGWRAGAAVGTGISLGFFLQALVVALCGTWVMQQAWAHWVLWGAAVWLLYLAWKIMPKTWTAPSAEAFEAGQGQEKLMALLGQGFLCNILNPKCMLFISGLSLGPLANYGDTFAWFAPAMVLGLTLSGLLGWVLWSVLLQWAPLRAFYLRHTLGFDALFAALLALFALLLLLN